MLSYKVMNLRTLLPHLSTTGTTGELSEGDVWNGGVLLFVNVVLQFSFSGLFNVILHLDIAQEWSIDEPSKIANNIHETAEFVVQ